MKITSKNYDERMTFLTERNLILSEQFLEMLKRLQIKNLNIASVGNSISAGYSKCDKILPFLMRSNIYKLSDDINYYSYARVRRNEEMNILRWYSSNISHKEINDLNIDDIVVKESAYVEKHWNGSTIKNYEEIANKCNKGFRDFNLLDNSVIIYNGLTGAFTNAMRKGSVSDKLKIFTTFKKDIEDAKLVLTQMYLDNPSTQIYICGLPNIMGSGIISFLDKNIKEIIKQVPNAIYLKGTFRNAFYYLEGQKEFDVHYSQPEYIDLWNNITEAMINNYVPQKLAISLIEELKQYSLSVERESTISKGCDKAISKIIEKIIEKHINLLRGNNQSLNCVLEKVEKYYQNNYLSIFPCTPKEKVLGKINSIKTTK